MAGWQYERAPGRGGGGQKSLWTCLLQADLPAPCVQQYTLAGFGCAKYNFDGIESDTVITANIVNEEPQCKSMIIIIIQYFWYQCCEKNVGSTCNSVTIDVDQLAYKEVRLNSKTASSWRWTCKELFVHQYRGHKPRKDWERHYWQAQWDSRL